LSILSKSKKKHPANFRIIIYAILLGLIIRIFFIDSFKIPTSSMSPTLISGDYVLVNKLILGPRIYQNFNFFEKRNIVMKRLKGFRRIRRNDVLVFNYPYTNPNKLKLDLNTFYIKRCIAIPHDTFNIENGIYEVKGFLDTVGIYQRQIQLSQIPDYELKKEIFHCFPLDPNYSWNIKYFGPLYVPGKGDEIVINFLNLPLYRNLITYETEKEIEVVDGKVYLDGEVLSSYIFQKDYYFMAGDWIFDSFDSRYWGLLPEDLIVGKVAFIWKSIDIPTGKCRFERFFKVVK
jgi:signal peptidase I